MTIFIVHLTIVTILVLLELTLQLLKQGDKNERTRVTILVLLELTLQWGRNFSQISI